MKIFVDADACPVQNEISFSAAQYDIPVVFVKSYAHFSHEETAAHVETIYVDKGAEMADMKIMQLIQANDIVITQDYGLASLCLPRGCTVIHHKGFLYTEENIEQLLAQRYASAQARRAGKRTRGPKPFTEQEREKFQRFFQRLLEKKMGV